MNWYWPIRWKKYTAAFTAISKKHKIDLRDASNSASYFLQNKTTVHIRILPSSDGYRQMIFTFQIMYNFYWRINFDMLSYTQQREHSLNGLPSKFGRVVPSVFEVRRGNFFIYLKSCFSYFCIKAIIATISRPNVKIQPSASKVTILPPPQRGKQYLFVIIRLLLSFFIILNT